jgi:3-deoxy-D-manno-octulosonic-acid transferase
MSFARFVYSALVRALLPAAVLRLLLRGRREPGYRAHMAERFGRYAQPRPPELLIWIHAVSVGETRAAEPLVRALLASHPAYRILLTHMTPTGRRMGESVFGEKVLRAYLPYDAPGAVARFLDHYRPRAGIILETEVWPNLVYACKSRGIPLCLLNARLSEKSLRGYLRVGAFVRDTFAAFTVVGAQSAEDAERLRRLGATKVEVMGNLKFDVTPPVAQLELGRTWRAQYNRSRVLLAASTREGEEALLLDVLPRLPQDVLVLIVPRHPQRFDEVAALIENRGIRYQRRSANAPLARDTRMLLGDSMGEMFAYYAACDAAFIGGSLLPYGAQNLIEACAAGKAVLIGPHTYNFAEAAERALEAGAALRVRDAQELVDQAAMLLGNPAKLEEMGARGLEFTHAHRGATERVMQILTACLTQRDPATDSPP